MSFERPSSAYQMQAWIATFKKEAMHQLFFHVEIINALFFVKVDLLNVDAIKLALIANSPIQAINQHALVNDYPKDFDPCNPREFKHLVTIVINRGSEAIHKHLEDITKPIGCLVKSGNINSSIEHYHMTALVETTL